MKPSIEMKALYVLWYVLIGVMVFGCVGCTTLTPSTSDIDMSNLIYQLLQYK